MPTVKVENYTKEMTAKMVDMYTAVGKGVTDADHDKRAAVVKQLAAEFKKSERSIRSKLVREQVDGESVYIKRIETSKVTGEKPEKKEVLADRLVKASGLKVTADSISKMNKTDIQAFLTYFNSLIVDEVETDILDEIEAIDRIISPENAGELTD